MIADVSTSRTGSVQLEDSQIQDNKLFIPEPLYSLTK